jgi:Ca2+-binding RTX toxin-like protein
VIELTATLNLDGADDNVTVSVGDGLLVHGQTTGGLNSGRDWASDKEGDQTVAADGTFMVIVNGGDGNDRLVAGKGDDVMNGGTGNDTLVWNQGDGSDRANGDAGNDG